MGLFINSFPARRGRDPGSAPSIDIASPLPDETGQRALWCANPATVPEDPGLHHRCFYQGGFGLEVGWCGGSTMKLGGARSQRRRESD